MSGSTTWQQWKVPVRLTSMIRAQDSALISVNGEKSNSPALVTRTVIAPSSLRTLANAFSTAGRSVTSAPNPMAVIPTARRSSATRCAASSLTSTTATLSPRRPNSWQVASPMPEAPPVTTATLLIDCAPLPLASWRSLVNHPHGAAGRQGLTGQHPAVVHFILLKRVVVDHPGAALRQAGHARSAGTDFA